MEAVDTNVLARLLLNDDPEQVALARALVERTAAARTRIFVPLTVILELSWVLRSVAKLDRTALAESMRLVTTSKELDVEHEGRVLRAIERYASGPADFADYLHLEGARDRHCVTMRTFDRTFASEAEVDMVG